MTPPFPRVAAVLLLSFLASAAFAQIAAPELPHTGAVVTCMPDTTGYARITVGPAGRDYTDLQSAINAASPGTVLVLDAGATFNGSFTLPEKTGGNGWIIITGSAMNLLPVEETRITPTAATGNATYPTQAAAMPKIVTTNTSGVPCFKTAARAHHYRLIGLEVTAATAVLNSYGLINLGSASETDSTNLPHDLVIDRCYIHGHTAATIMKYGVRLDCRAAAVVESCVSDFHSVGYDAQAISCVNGSGPFRILNNYLEASGENILFGGGAPAIAGLVPQDIEVCRNYFFKPHSWWVSSPDYAGKHWTVKNLFELKTGKRVLLDGNILENSWADLPTGQSGYAILLTIRTESGNAPQADVSDVTITNNIIRHTGAGISISGRDAGSTGIRSERIRIANNLFEDINGPLYGDGNDAGPNVGTFLQIGEPKDVVVDHNTIFQTGVIVWAYKVMDGFSYTNNLAASATSAGGYQGIYGPGYSQGNNTIAHYFPDVTDANQRIHKNVLIGGNAAKYTSYNTVSANYFPANTAAVGFVNYAAGATDYHNYALSGSSLYHNNAADGSDIGVHIPALDSAMASGPDCSAATAVAPSTVPGSTLFSVFPNPGRGDLRIVTAGDGMLRVFNAMGKLVLSAPLRAGAQAIRLPEGTAAGVYVLSYQGLHGERQVARMVYEP